ncbi:hypothetical protein [Bradyrhizobium sp.]
MKTGRASNADIAHLRAVAKLAGEGPIMGRGLEHRRYFDPVRRRAERMFGVDQVAALTKVQVAAMVAAYRDEVIRKRAIMPRKPDPDAPKPTQALVKAMYLSGRVIGKDRRAVAAEVLHACGLETMDDLTLSQAWEALRYYRDQFTFTVPAHPSPDAAVLRWLERWWKNVPGNRNDVIRGMAPGNDLRGRP